MSTTDDLSFPSFVPSQKLITCVIHGYCERNNVSECDVPENLVCTIFEGFRNLCISMYRYGEMQHHYFLTTSLKNLEREVLEALLWRVLCGTNDQETFSIEFASCLIDFAEKEKTPEEILFMPTVVLIDDRVALLPFYNHPQPQKPDSTRERAKVLRPSNL